MSAAHQQGQVCLSKTTITADHPVTRQALMSTFLRSPAYLMRRAKKSGVSRVRLDLAEGVNGDPLAPRRARLAA